MSTGAARWHFRCCPLPSSAFVSSGWYARFRASRRGRSANETCSAFCTNGGAGNGLRMVVMICLYNMALMALLSMIPLYLAERHGFGPEAAGIAFSAMLIVGAAAQPWVGKISDVAGRRPVVVFGNVTAALAIALLVFQPSLWAVLGAMVIAVAALDAIRAAVLAGAVDHAGRSEGTTLGLAFALLDGIGALGAVLAGIAAGFSWSHMFVLAAAFSLGAAVLGLITVFGASASTVRTQAVEQSDTPSLARPKTGHLRYCRRRRGPLGPRGRRPRRRRQVGAWRAPHRGAARISPGCSTRMPSAPMDLAISAKFDGVNSQASPQRPSSLPPRSAISLVNAWLSMLLLLTTVITGTSQRTAVSNSVR